MSDPNDGRPEQEAPPAQDQASPRRGDEATSPRSREDQSDDPTTASTVTAASVGPEVPPRESDPTTAEESAGPEAAEESTPSETAAGTPETATSDPPAPDEGVTDPNRDLGADEAAGSEPGGVVALDEASLWRSSSRAIVLFGLLGMALPTWIRLSRNSDLAQDLLKKNAMPMPDRDVFLLQILGSGVGLAFLVLCLCMFWTKPADTPRRLEQWGWFLSPLILLPAIPVVGAVSVWHQRHHEFLPVVLFLALLTEFFFSRALVNVPGAVKESLPEFSWTVGRVTEGHFLRRNAWLILAVSGALFYAIFMSYFTVRWHNRLGTATFDLGINNNLIFGGLHGKFNQSTVIFPDDPQKYLANHVKLGLYLFLPIYALHPEAETLLVLQSISLGLGSIPLFLFARRRIPEWAALVLAFAYLAYYPMHGANFYEMKMVPTAAAFVLTMIWAVDSRRWVTTVVFFLMSLIMREDLPVPLAVIGGFLLLSGHRPRAGAVICGVSVFWFVLVRFKVMSDAGAWWFPNMYEDLWSKPETGFRSVLKTLVSNPTFVLDHIFTEKKFWYLMHLMVPLAFLPVRRWYLWAALVPGAILTLLVTNYDPPVMFSFQYVMHWSPYLFVAAAVAVAAIAQQKDGRARASAAIAAVAVASTALSFNYGAFPLRDRHLEAGYHKIRFGWGPEEQVQFEEVQRLKRDIPRDASVATTERIGAHLSSRVLFYTLRRGNQGATYLVARRSGLRLGKTKRVITDALQSGEYGVVGRYGEFVLMKKGADIGGNDAILKEWRLLRRSSRRSDRNREQDEDESAEDESAEDESAEDESAEDEDSPGEDSPTDEAEEDAPEAETRPRPLPRPAPRHPLPERRVPSPNKPAPGAASDGIDGSK